MASYPYVLTMKRLGDFFKKIQSVGIPQKADIKWLASIGFTTKNDRRILGVLSHTGFVDSEGKPTDHWNSYRDKKKAKRVLAEGIMEGYSELYKTYPEAHKQTDTELRNFFRSTTNLGTKAIGLTLGTFKTLRDLADFTKVSVAEGVDYEPAVTEVEPVAPIEAKTIVHEAEAGVTVNINIQITLPEGADEKTYSKFFAAMAEHLPLKGK